ncbi:two component transcriptional regulator, winged helix family [Gottschalkia purinilytica]|uniref:Two component transcriptional regulator, winged helix family n=1 Tax=Gottschalkia purinilytica TaxID=1503 RepID=A0A0L0W8H8_GOTPU|nr:response regulator transcription factor [Gottschalkia purinilytica]KNF07752.1 two component transcriptional regulator, winged helix family [Gottschalkia purinilytica]
MNYKIMIVEDDTSIANLLSDYIEKYGYETIVVKDFEKVLEIFEEENPHLVLLDVNLPRYDGYYWCRKIRNKSLCPIIFISARVGEIEQVMAIESGADDYITKPFYYDVVIAKIKSQLRRSYGNYSLQSQQRTIEVEGLTLYPEVPELRYNDKTVITTKKESILIEILISNYPKSVSRDILLEKLWDDQSFVEENTLNVNVARLRKRLQELDIEEAIKTVRGVGYRLEVTWRND